MAFVRVFLVYLVSVVVMAALGVIAQSLFVLAGLSGVGADINLTPALSMLVDDLMGLAPIYAVIIALGFLIALPVAALVGRLLPLPRGLVFAVAGAVCIAVMLTLMKEVFFGVQLIAGARSLAGFCAQAMVGGLAGLVFVALTPAPRTSKSA